MTNPLLKKIKDAVTNGDEEDLKELIMTENFSGQINEKMTPEGHTALLMAVEARQAGCVKILLEHGASANAVLDDGNSGLHLAAALEVEDEDDNSQKQQQKIVETLIAAGASVTARNSDNKTPSMLAKVESAVRDRLETETRDVHHGQVMAEFRETMAKRED